MYAREVSVTKLAIDRDNAVRSNAVMRDMTWFHAAVERWRGTVFRVAYSSLRSWADADDVCQDVFVALYRSGREFADDEHLKAWLIRVTINRCKSEFRRPWRRVESIDDHDVGTEESTSRRLEVRAAVLALPRRYRVPVYLFYYEGYGTAEIAQLLGTKDTTVRSWLRRARKRLAEVLEGGEYDD